MGKAITSRRGEGKTSQAHGDRIILYNDERFYYCGTWRGEMDWDATAKPPGYFPNGNNGRSGDVRARPVTMGPGEYTVTIGSFDSGDVTWEK